MGLDHSNAFVRLTFDGLISSCRGADNRFEMGMVQADDHDPLMSIIRINPDGTKKRILKNFRLVRNEEIVIEAVAPVTQGATLYNGSVFDPVSDLGDPEDFRWAMDLQSDRFHGSNLMLNRDRGATLLRPRIKIPHGIFYTKEKSPTAFARFKQPDRSPKTPIGKIADLLGSDILCNFENGQKTVNVTIGDSEPIPLDFQTREGLGFFYKIRITNLCRRSGGGPRCKPQRSDFPRYYDVLTDRLGVKFDLDPIFPPGDPRGTTPIDEFNDKHFREFKGFRTNGPPEICAISFLGGENSIP